MGWTDGWMVDVVGWEDGGKARVNEKRRGDVNRKRSEEGLDLAR